MTMKFGKAAATRITNRAVGPVGYGMLGLTVPWAPLEHDIAATLLKKALEQGANLWNTVCYCWLCVLLSQQLADLL
jgi:pyridoxine 4-dehydrogenase